MHEDRFYVLERKCIENKVTNGHFEVFQFKINMR